VQQADARDASIAQVLREFNPISHLIVTVGNMRCGGPFATLDLAELRAGFEGKIWAQVTTLQAARPFLTQGGSVTPVSASTAGASIPAAAGFAAFNGALEAMVPVLAVELAPTRVNAVVPGIIDTPLWGGLPEGERSQALAAFASPLRGLSRKVYLD